VVIKKNQIRWKIFLSSYIINVNLQNYLTKPFFFLFQTCSLSPITRHTCIKALSMKQDLFTQISRVKTSCCCYFIQPFLNHENSSIWYIRVTIGNDICKKFVWWDARFLGLVWFIGIVIMVSFIWHHAGEKLDL